MRPDPPFTRWEKVMYLLLGIALGISAAATVVILCVSMFYGLLIATVGLCFWALALVVWLFVPVRL